MYGVILTALLATSPGQCAGGVCSTGPQFAQNRGYGVRPIARLVAHPGPVRRAVAHGGPIRRALFGRR